MLVRLVDTGAREDVPNIQTTAEVSGSFGVVEVMVQGAVAVHQTQLAQKGVGKRITTVALIGGPQSPPQPYQPHLGMDAHEQRSQARGEITLRLLDGVRILGRKAVCSLKLVVLFVESIHQLGVKSPVRAEKNEGLTQIASDELQKSLLKAREGPVTCRPPGGKHRVDEIVYSKGLHKKVLQGDADDCASSELWRWLLILSSWDFIRLCPLGFGQQHSVSKPQQLVDHKRPQCEAHSIGQRAQAQWGSELPIEGITAE